jgi:hypothetical protein
MMGTKRNNSPAELPPDRMEGNRDLLSRSGDPGSGPGRFTINLDCTSKSQLWGSISHASFPAELAPTEWRGAGISFQIRGPRVRPGEVYYYFWIG